ncbi:hypothetical protein L9F63_023414, partial [Diploptera punctata]
NLSSRLFCLLPISDEMLNKLLKKWQDYRFRFVPWIAFNLKHRSKRLVKGESEDKVVPDDVLLDSLLKILPRLQSAANTGLTQAQVADKNSKEIESVLGFRLNRASSKLPDAGLGVVVTSGCIERGTLVALYPGTLYQAHEPILLPSIGNPFIFRCIDGINIDGNDRRISKIIYKSCVGRESFKSFQAADVSWLTETPVIPLNVGQYVNNHSQ